MSLTATAGFSQTNEGFPLKTSFHNVCCPKIDSVVQDQQFCAILPLGTTLPSSAGSAVLRVFPRIALSYQCDRAAGTSH